MSWDQRFSEPILLADGRKLRTLRDAATYITSLPKVERDAAQWQTAAELLMLVAESGGDPMMPRIAMMKALHRNFPRSQSAQRRKHVKAYRIVR
jgi:hypothetical protein